MAEGRAAGLMNLALVDETEEADQEDCTLVTSAGQVLPGQFLPAWHDVCGDDDDEDPSAITAVHVVDPFGSEADAADPTHVEKEAPVTSASLAPATVRDDSGRWKRSDIRGLAPRLGPPGVNVEVPSRPAVELPPRTSSTLIPPASRASRLQSQPPEPMLFTPSAMPPPPSASPTQPDIAEHSLPPKLASTLIGHPAPSIAPSLPPATMDVPSSALVTSIETPHSPPARSSIPPAAPPPLESAVVLSKPTPQTKTEPPLPRPAKTPKLALEPPRAEAKPKKIGLALETPAPKKVEGAFFAIPMTEGSVVVPLEKKSEAKLVAPLPAEPKIDAKVDPRKELESAPAPAPPRPPSASFADLKDLVVKAETDLAKRPTEPVPAMGPQPAREPRPPLHAMAPPPMPRASALGLEAYASAPPPEMALETVLPPAPPQQELISDHAIPLNPLGHASQLALEAVVPKKPAPIAFFLTSLFFVGYIIRAMFGRVVDASAQLGELGREGFLALVALWAEAGKRARR